MHNPQLVRVLRLKNILLLPPQNELYNIIIISGLLIFERLCVSYISGLFVDFDYTIITIIVKDWLQKLEMPL